MSAHDDPTDASAEKARLRPQGLLDLAHELRGSAGVILGALQELELALGEDLGKHQAMLAMAKRGVTRVMRTADQLQQSDQHERPSAIAS